MSGKAAAADAPGKGKRGLKKIIIIAAVLALLAGGGAFYIMKKNAAAAAAAAAEEEGESAGDASSKKDPKLQPTFLALDPFTVNLADKEVDRYIQVGITLKIDDEKMAENLKLYMPAIRNNILMILSHKTTKDISDREGKELLAKEIRKEVVRPLGIEIEDEVLGEAPVKKKKKKKAQPNPVTDVLFVNFIIQ
jgi:flagellar protein FliL